MIRVLPRLLASAGVILITANPLCADAGPKSFTVVELGYDLGWLDQVDTILLEVRDSQGGPFHVKAGFDSSPPWLMSAHDEHEHLRMVNGWPMRLAIVIGTDTLRTPELADNGHKSFFRFHVGDGGLEDRSPITHTYWLDYLGALLITIGLEVLLAWPFFRVYKWPRRQLWTVVVANLITHPLLWLWLFSTPVNGPYTLFWAEGAVVVVEAVILSLLLKPRPGFIRPFAMSLIMNTVSFLLGGVLYFFWLVR